VKEVRPDAVIATGRSDYPNQVNNVLCFPFIFRGTLDAGATEINLDMQLACTRALADLAHAPASAEAAAAYRDERLLFGRDYLIPKPFDPRLLASVASAVAQAAADSGVATRPIADMEAYRERLNRVVYRSGFVMKPIFERARQIKRRIVFAEGEDERVLQAANAVIEEGVDVPIMIGRPRVIAGRCEKLGLPIRPERDFEICNPEDDPRYSDYWRHYHARMKRDGVSPDLARTVIRTNTTAIAAVMVDRGEADSLICGTFGGYHWHLKYVENVLGEGRRRHAIGALAVIILTSGPVFLADTQVHSDPTPEQLVEITTRAAAHVRRFGIEPKVALISESNFGSLDTAPARKMRRAVELLDAAGVDFEYEGEMHADAAVDPSIRERLFPDTRLTGSANLLIMPTLAAASAAKNILKGLADGLQIGPILMGLGGRAHIVTPSITARGLLNVAALAGAGEIDA
jgi:malate dehydrogenase (oxaloacetate-decarboxylating)(NADP+)